jgi:hypothetical protein
MLLYLKRASNARPYKRILNVLVGATIGRPLNNVVTLRQNGGSKPPPYNNVKSDFKRGEQFQSFLTANNTAKTPPYPDGGL